MKRRQFVRLVQVGACSALTTTLITKWAADSAQVMAQTADTGNLTVRWLGHTCFQFTGGGLRVLVNPFRQLGCTAGYSDPKVDTDLVLISSRLLDEGAVENFPGNPSLLYEAGVYQFNDTQVQGIRTIKDRRQGRQFGTNVAWLWTQAGVKILHLGGLASPIDLEERILIGRPDIVFIPVGGGPKSYTPEEAKQTLGTLKPQLIVPTHYRTAAADAASCDLVPVDEFLTVMQGTSVQRLSGNTLTVGSSLLSSNEPIIQVFNYGDSTVEDAEEIEETS